MGLWHPASSSALVPLTPIVPGNCWFAPRLCTQVCTDLSAKGEEGGRDEPKCLLISDLLLLLNPEHCLECLLQRGMKWMFI